MPVASCRSALVYRQSGGVLACRIEHINGYAVSPRCSLVVMGWHVGLDLEDFQQATPLPGGRRSDATSTAVYVRSSPNPANCVGRRPSTTQDAVSGPRADGASTTRDGLPRSAHRQAGTRTSQLGRRPTPAASASSSMNCGLDRSEENHCMLTWENVALCVGWGVAVGRLGQTPEAAVAPDGQAGWWSASAQVGPEPANGVRRCRGHDIWVCPGLDEEIGDILPERMKQRNCLPAPECAPSGMAKNHRIGAD